MSSCLTTDSSTTISSPLFYLDRRNFSPAFLSPATYTHHHHTFHRFACQYCCCTAAVRHIPCTPWTPPYLLLVGWTVPAFFTCAATTLRFGYSPAHTFAAGWSRACTARVVPLLLPAHCLHRLTVLPVPLYAACRRVPPPFTRTTRLPAHTAHACTLLPAVLHRLYCFAALFSAGLFPTTRCILRCTTAPTTAAAPTITTPPGRFTTFTAPAALRVTVLPAFAGLHTYCFTSLLSATRTGAVLCCLPHACVSCLAPRCLHAAIRHHHCCVLRLPLRVHVCLPACLYLHFILLPFSFCLHFMHCCTTPPQVAHTDACHLRCMHHAGMKERRRKHTPVPATFTCTHTIFSVGLPLTLHTYYLHTAHASCLPFPFPALLLLGPLPTYAFLGSFLPATPHTSSTYTHHHAARFLPATTTTVLYSCTGFPKFSCHYFYFTGFCVSLLLLRFWFCSFLHTYYLLLRTCTFFSPACLLLLFFPTTAAGSACLSASVPTYLMLTACLRSTHCSFSTTYLHIWDIPCLPGDSCTPTVFTLPVPFLPHTPTVSSTTVRFAFVFVHCSTVLYTFPPWDY